jgi:hypothetical protein
MFTKEGEDCLVMNWRDFKERCEELGLRDEEEIGWIDVHYPSRDNIEIERLESDGGITNIVDLA